MIRRRGLLAAAGGVPLLLHLDGIDNTTNGHSSTTRTWYDQSGNGNDFSSGSALTWSANGLTKNGENAWITCNKAILSGKTAFTVEVCVKLQAKSNYQWVFTTRDTTNSYFQFYTGQNRSVVACALSIGGTERVATTSSVSDTDAVFTGAFTIGDNAVCFYSNGALTNTASLSGLDLSLLTAKSVYNIGNAYPWQNRLPCYGSIYSVKIYDGALSAAELLLNHQNNITRFGS